MKIGIFGGTFNPPHIGHVNFCKAFLEKINLDKLYVIPVNTPPHKTLNLIASPAQRLEMCKMAFQSLSQKVQISDVEIKRQGKSYTADTIAHFKAEGYDDIYFLCGTDMLLSLDTWYKPDYILANATIVYARRENEMSNSVLIKEKIVQYERNFGAKIIWLELDAIELSSSTIRDKVKKGESLSGLTTQDIMEYISKNELYKS